MVVFIKRLWHNEQSLQGAAGLLVVTMLVSNILGFLRDVILANTIPLETLDSYYAAFRLPDFLFNLFILGAISSAFIPVFLQVNEEDGDKAAWRLANNLVHVSLAVLLVFGSLLFVFMPQVLPRFVPGFEPARIDTTIQLARILLLSPLFFAVSYVVGGVLNAKKKFFAYSLAPLMYNAAIIVGGLLSLKYGVGAVAWAVVAGALLHLLVQLPSLIGSGYKYTFVFDLADKQLRRVIKLMVPRAISLGMSQIELVIFTSLGSLLPRGAVSIFSLTNNFQTTPVAIFAASIATAVFPHLGTASSQKNDKDFRKYLSSSMSGMLYTLIPATVLFWVFRAHVIRLYLALNHQTWGDTIRAIDTFEWFILALVAQGFSILIVRAFYARHDTVRPMVLALLGGVVSIGAASLLTARYPDVSSLSAAFFVGTTIEAILLAIVFDRAHPKLVDKAKVVRTTTLALLFSLVSGVLAKFTLEIVSDGWLHLFPALGTDRVVPLVVALGAAGIVGVVSYVALSVIFRREELWWIIPRRALASLPLADSESQATESGLTTSQ